MNEAKFTTKFIKWIKVMKNETIAFEVKITKGSSIPYAVLKDHQRDALYLAHHNKIVWKIPDLGVQNPFDGIMLDGVTAYVVVYYYKRGNRTFYLIPIDEWVRLARDGRRKSITEEMCKVFRFESGELLYP